MRWWLVLVSMGLSGAAHAESAVRSAMPIASRFDLNRFMAQPVAERIDRVTGSRWLIADIAPPPGPPHDAPLLRIRGKKVKFRMSF